MHFTPWPAWLMMVSTATVVLPVLRSPMISSRWPRPMGVMASMALMPGLQGLAHRLAADDARRLDLHAARLGAVDRALAVDRLAQRVHHPAQERVAHRHGLDPPGGLDRLLLFEVVHLAQDDGTDGVLVQVEGQARASRPRTRAARSPPRRAGPSTRAMPSPTSTIRPICSVPTAGVYSSTLRCSAAVISLASIVSSAINLLPLSVSSFRSSAPRRCGTRCLPNRRA